MQINTENRDANLYVLPPLRPKVWVFSVLAIVWIVSVLLGFRLWYQLGLPRKDPMPELELCGMTGFILAGAICSVGFHHTWHRSLFLAVTLGLLSGLTAVTWHVLSFEY